MGEIRERLESFFRLQSLTLVGHPILGDIHLDFCHDYYPGQNVYTSVVIGANGIGKSYLLRVLAELFCCLESLKKDAEITTPRYYFDLVYSSHWQKYEFANFRSINPASKQRRFTNYVFKREEEEIDSRQMELPNRVIASSTTITDKFVAKSTDMYRYKGLRNENSPSTTGTRTMVRKTVESLLGSLDEKYGFKEELRKLLVELKLRPMLDLSYNLRYKDVFVKEGMTTGELIHIFENQQGLFKRKTDIWGTKNFNTIKDKEPWKLDIAASLLSRLAQRGFGNGRQLLKYELLEDDPWVEEDREGLKVLTSLDLLSYPSLRVCKDGEDYTFDQSSSGESSLLCQMVGIMSDIEPNSLVLIDEPENSAHPNWQISYIGWLKKIFTQYANCHFVISTHSHFMLTDLEPLSSDIVALEKKDGVISDVSEDVNTFSWTVDDILYRVFHVRNTRNYVFEGKLIELYNLVSNRDDKMKVVRLIKELSQYQLNGDDPLAHLLKTAKNYVESV